MAKRKPYTNSVTIEAINADVEALKAAWLSLAKSVSQLQNPPIKAHDPEAAQYIENALIGGYIRDCQAKQPGANTVDLSRLEDIRTGIRLCLA